MLRLVFIHLRRMLQEKRYAEMTTLHQENSGAMGRLLRVVFDQQQFELKISKGCHHLRLRRYLSQHTASLRKN
jgi:hypothetical protein